MAISKSKSVTQQFTTMVALACTLGIVFSLFGLSNLFKHNSHLLELSEIKLDVLSTLDRLNEIQHEHARYYLNGSTHFDSSDFSQQFTTQLNQAKANLSNRYDSNFQAIESAWSSLLALKNDNSTSVNVFNANNLQLVSHLKVLKQNALAFIGEDQQATRDSSHFAIFVTAFCSGVGMFLGVVLMMRQAKRISNSLTELGQGMEMASVGDLTKRVNIKCASEVEALSEGFNFMMSELERKTLEVLASEQGLLAVMNSAPDAIITTDMQGTIFSWNNACETMFAYKLDEISGQKFQTILDPNQQVDFNNILKEIRETEVKGKQDSDGPWELSVRRKDGIHIPIEITIRRMIVEAVEKLVIVGRDITERKATEEKMAFLTQHDILTHLPNRTLIRERLVQTMERADEAERLVGVISLGIDKFADINNNLGHTLADGLLVALVDRINDILSRRDQFGRLGGDEFCIIIDNMCRVEETSKLTDKIAMCFEEPFILAGHQVYITASFGISIYPFDDESPESLLKHASAAMSRCKRDESVSYLYYSTKMNSANCGRVKLTVELRRAIEENQFLLYFQPQYDIKTNKLVGVEALLRWQHPELGLLEPESFISVLEESGLIIPVSELLMVGVAKKIIKWNNDQRCRVSVNLSSRQLTDEVYFSKLVRHIKRLKRSLFNAGLIKDVDADISDFLEFELTESLLMENTDSSKKILYAIKQLGINLSVDDFGTGYSSLSYLQQFPIDSLKIDQSFVKDIGTDQGAELIIKAVIDLAHNLDLKVIGEGVETPQQLEFLRDKKCDEVQGFLYSDPITEKKFESLFEYKDPEERKSKAKAVKKLEEVEYF